MRAVILAMERNSIFDINRPLALVRVCGVSLITRILNSLRAAGVKEALIVLGSQGEEITRVLKDGKEIGMRLLYFKPEELAKNPPSDFLDDTVLVLSTDIVIDAEFVSEIMRKEDNVACFSNNKPVGVYKIGRDSSRLLYDEDVLKNVNRLLELVSLEKIDTSKMEVDHVDLKRKISPICIKIDSKEALELAKKKLVFRTQKGLHFTSYINKPIEDRVIYCISDIPWITPNRITILTNLSAFIVATLLLVGYLKMGAVLAYVVGILDGLDGKLARARGILTKLGYIEHTFDMLYEQASYICFALNLYVLEGNSIMLILGLLILLSDSFVRHCYMQFKETMGRALTTYSRFDRFFARVDGRRNAYVIYMILFSWLPWLGGPAYALYAMLLHSSITAVVYVVRAIQHMSTADRESGVKGFLRLVGKP